MSSWLSFMLLVSLCLSFNGVSGARHRKEHHPEAILTGTVYCDACFPQEVPKSTQFISGATVAVECAGDGMNPRFYEEAKTNDKGEFEAKLPASAAKNAGKIKSCSVKLISSSNPYCAVAATATSSDIHSKSKKPGAHIFSAGFFTFKPQLCNQKNSLPKDFPPSLPDPPAPFLPPISGGLLPPVPLPDLPNLPGVPLPPTPITRQNPPQSNKLSDQKVFGIPFPPNPFQPPQIVPPLPFQPSPPSLLPPLPFQPSPPSLIPPIFPSPPPASLFPPLPFPPVPSLIPSPPPPPPPAFPIPLPPIPKIPGLPPVPPASSSQHAGKTTP